MLWASRRLRPAGASGSPTRSRSAARRQSRPRPGRARRDGARRARQDPRHPRARRCMRSAPTSMGAGGRAGRSTRCKLHPERRTTSRRVHVTSRAVFTQHGADRRRTAAPGRPEAVYLTERLIDRAAREMWHRPGRAPAAQLHRAEAMPYAHARPASIYDSGEFAGDDRPMPRARRLDGLCRPARGRASGRGRLRGRAARSTTSRTAASSTTGWSCASIRAAR